MNKRKPGFPCHTGLLLLVGLAVLGPPASGQMIDQTQAPNVANDGINKNLAEQVGSGRGDWTTPGSSSFIISRDPFRAIRRGRQIFQRKFSRLQQQGPAVQDGLGDINTTITMERAWRTVVPAATAVRAEPAAPGEMSSPAPTAGMRRTCSAWDSRRCWPTRSRVSFAGFERTRSSPPRHRATR